jgi:CheY-like chemotaxis protein
MTTWMVVEDEPDLYDMVLAMYDTLGVNGVAFANGEEALEWIDAVENGHFQDEIPELALIDIRLPGQVNGVQIGERMRKSLNLRDTTIVFMTAYRLSPDDEKKVRQAAEADELLYKPLPDINTFERKLRALITKRHNQTAE